MKAKGLYIDFVREGVGLPPIWNGLRQQIYIGSDTFIQSMLKLAVNGEKCFDDVPLIQHRGMPKRLEEYREQSNSRNEAIRLAFSSGGYTMKQIGGFFELHYTSISRIVNKVN